MYVVHPRSDEHVMCRQSTYNKSLVKSKRGGKEKKKQVSSVLMQC